MSLFPFPCPEPSEWRVDWTALDAEYDWIRAMRGKDKRERVFSLTQRGRRQLALAQPCWEGAQRRLRKELGDAGWTNMKQAVSQMTEAALAP